MTLPQLKKYVAFAKKAGLKSLRVGGVEFQFDDRPSLPKRLLQSVPKASTSQAQAQIPIEGMPSNTDMLFWSADENKLALDEKDDAA